MKFNLNYHSKKKSFSNTPNHLIKREPKLRPWCKPSIRKNKTLGNKTKNNMKESTTNFKISMRKNSPKNNKLTPWSGKSTDKSNTSPINSNIKNKKSGKSKIKTSIKSREKIKKTLKDKSKKSASNPSSYDNKPTDKLKFQEPKFKKLKRLQDKKLKRKKDNFNSNFKLKKNKFRNCKLISNKKFNK